MKKNKKITTLLIAMILFLVPLTPSFAYEGGLLNGKTLTRGQDAYNPTTSVTAITDSNETSGVTIGAYAGNDTIVYNFSEPVSLSSYRLLTSNFSLRNLNLKAVLSDNTVVTISDSLSYDSTRINFPTLSQVKKVYLENLSTSSLVIYEFDVFSASVVPEIVYDDISSLVSTKTHEKVDLSWSAPSDNSAFVSLKIYRDGSLIATVPKSQSSYIDTSVTSNTSYGYKVTAIYSDGYETVGLSKTVQTDPLPDSDGDGIPDIEDEYPDDPDNIPPEPLKVKQLQGEAKSSISASFSWSNPDNKLFQKVSVYQDGIKLGETEGESFSVSNLKESTTYRFAFKVIDVNGAEGEAQEISIKTPSETVPDIEDAGFVKQPNGDYNVSWSEPTTGAMKILIAGKVYAEVPASDKGFTVPGADVKYNAFGDPDITLKPVSESGKEGEPTKPPSNVKTPFTPTELLEAGNGLLWYIGPILLLGLSFLLVPKLRRMIVQSIGNKETQSDRDERRFFSDGNKEEWQRQREKREQHQGREYIEKIKEKERKELEKLEAKQKEGNFREPRMTRIKPERMQREGLTKERGQRQVREARPPREKRIRVREPRKPRSERS